MQFNLADVQLISKYNKGFQFILCVINSFSKYAWVFPLKDKVFTIGDILCVKTPCFFKQIGGAIPADNLISQSGT